MKRETIWTGNVVALERLDDYYEVVRHAPAVSVLATRGDGHVLGIVQPRPAVDADTWELPAGLIDPGETPVQAAERELREEADLCATLTPLTRMYVSPGFTDELVHLFEARDLTPCRGTPDPNEELTVAWRDPLQVWREVADGRLATSAVTVVGLRHLLAARGIVP
ncbi:MAG: NUDIX hydrolase [Trueperaceae bacterium]